MKTSVKSLVFISIAFIALNCAHDEKMLVKSNIQFSVTVSTKPADGGRLASLVLPDSAYVSLSIETTSGVSVYSRKYIGLIKLGSDYITSPLDLVAGNYRLADFMILSKRVKCCMLCQNKDRAWRRLWKTRCL